MFGKFFSSYTIAQSIEYEDVAYEVCVGDAHFDYVIRMFVGADKKIENARPLCFASARGCTGACVSWDGKSFGSFGAGEVREILCLFQDAELDHLLPVRGLCDGTQALIDLVGRDCMEVEAALSEFQTEVPVVDNKVHLSRSHPQSSRRN